jgi:hypothetical protein
VGAGIEKAHCVDFRVFCELRPELRVDLKPRPTRPQCGCIESVDIGAYDSCVFGCAYCYATSSRAAALSRLKAHNAASPALMAPRSTG